MKLIIFTASLLSFSISSHSNAQEVASWKDVSGGIRENEILSIGVAPWNSQEIYAGTSSGIYQTIDQGAHWKKVMATKGTDPSVYCISFSGKGSDVIYAGTGNGLYRSADYGKHWKQVFQEGTRGKRGVFWVEPLQNDSSRAYAATSGGLLVTEDGGESWDRLKEPPIHSSLQRVLVHPKEKKLWVVADEGIFFSKDGGESWERIWISPSEPREEEEGEEEIQIEQAQEIEEFNSTQRVNHLVLQPNGNGQMRLLAGTSMGLFVKEEDQTPWQPLPETGVNAPGIRFLTLDPRREDGIFIGTDQGAYYWDGTKAHWEVLSTGMIGRRIHELEFSPSANELWAATDQGVFYADLTHAPLFAEQKRETPNFLTSQELLARYRQEPAIEQVQQWATRYAEVHPEKIQQWRQQAKTKAYLPEISFTLDHDRSRTIDLDRGGTNDPDRYIIGPDDRSLDFDFSLSWDLADLIWSTDQTSIDVRSRLMVQLRDDILDEVTRLYFERRRLQVERELSPSEDIRLQATRDLRLEELTAQIDALTGGEFSRRFEKG